MSKPKKIAIKIGQSVVFVDRNGNECAALVNAALSGNRISLHYFPTGNTSAIFMSSVPHYNDVAAGDMHWKKG